MAGTFILKNDKLEDCFVKTDLSEDIRRFYEREKVIIIDELDFFGQYKQFIDHQVVSFVVDEASHLKKISSQQLFKIITHDHPLCLFTKDPFELQKITLDVYIWIKKTILQLFPCYHILSDRWSWRLTTTKNDKMHLDSYVYQTNDLHNVNAYINLGDKPLVFRVSYPLVTIYKKNQDFINSINKSNHPNVINSILNKEIHWRTLPFHEIYLAPYSMCLFNAQMIPHQLVRSEKLAAFTFSISPESMLHPELTFEKLSKHYHWCVSQQSMLF